jgi:plasmid rolling circle replication initiator protein Rep
MKSQAFKKTKILKDIDSKGKKRKWRVKKISSLHISKIYENISRKQKKILRELIKNGAIVEERKSGLYVNGIRVVNYEKRAGNMKFCGSNLDFANTGNGLKLIKANFCRVPLCPMCQWRKSLRVFFDTSKIVDKLEERHKNLKPIFLTLTVKNCSVENLGLTLDNMFKSWDLMLHSSKLLPIVDGVKRNVIKGWFRALEVTYNSKTNEFHPHFHVIMYVDKSYFTGKDYLKTADWVQLWRKSAKLDYDPICDVRKADKRGKRKEVAEVAKYTFKDVDILKETLSDKTKADVIESLSGALHQRRLYAYGGLMKSIAAELKIKDADKSNLVTVDGSKINPMIVKEILSYRWNMGLRNYVLMEKKESEQNE